ncbi:MAG: hypothetical protein WCP53_04240 [Verrucomicrobiota bacterium]
MKSNSLKELVVAFTAASVMTVVPAFALSSVEVEAVNKSLNAARVVELPALASKLVLSAAKEDKEKVAVAAVTSTIRNHPGAMSTVITAVVSVAPETIEAVVEAALNLAPDSALSIVASAASGAPKRANKAAAIAAKRMPSRAASFEREVAIVRGRRLFSTAAAFGDVGVTQIATNTFVTVFEDQVISTLPGGGKQTNVVLVTNTVVANTKEEAITYAGGDSKRPNNNGKTP